MDATAPPSANGGGSKAKAAKAKAKTRTRTRSGSKAATQKPMAGSSGAKAAPEENGGSAEPAGSAAVPGSRRERKKKFDVKQLLNIRQQGAGAGAAGSEKSPATSAGSSRRSSKDEESVKPASTPTTTTPRRSGRGSAPATPTVNGGKEASSAPSTPSSGVLTGKRERKRKKFWDEISPATPTPSKVSKKNTPTPSPASNASTSASNSNNNSNSNSNSGGTHGGNSNSHPAAAQPGSETPGGRKRVSSSSGSAGNAAASSPSTAKNRRERKRSGSAAKSTGANNVKSQVNGAAAAGGEPKGSSSHKGRTPVKDLKYLSLDLSLDPAEVAKKMVEGVNIPGPGDPIPVASSNLPPGWEKKVIQRGIGITKGKWDVFIQSPQGKSFRSKMELQRFFDEKKLPHSSETFDFSLDDTLKKLRQIWKNHIVIPAMKKKAGKDKEKDKDKEEGSKKNATSSEAAASTAAAVSNPPQQQQQQAAHSAAASTPLAAQINSAQCPASDASAAEATSTLEEEIALAALEFGTESETGQGVRCCIEKCSKLFRNDRLLHMHVKHYHPAVYENFRAAPNIHNRSASVSSPADPAAASSTSVSSTRPHGAGPKSDLLQSSPLSAAAAAAAASAATTRPTLPPAAATTPSSSSTGPVSKKRKVAGSQGGRDRDRDRDRKASGDVESPTFRRNLSRLSSVNKRSSIGSVGSVDDDDQPLASASSSSGRNRNDSILSVGSEASVGSTFAAVDDGHNPPTFRVSKRRQQQLKKKTKQPQQPQGQLSHMSPILRVNKLDDTSDGKVYMEEYMSFLHGAGGDSNSTDGGGQASMPPSYPPSEMDASVASEHLTTEEVVNCKCRRIEEDGLMIQCDICLCWQHGLCLGLDDEDLVPEKHVCGICKDPTAARTHSKFALDQDWMKEGRLSAAWLPRAGDRRRDEEEATEPPKPGPGPPSPASLEQLIEAKREANAFRKLSELMADLANLSKVLHSLRVKLFIASQKNHSKVFMWSSPWEESGKGDEEKQQQQPHDPTSLLAASPKLEPMDTSTAAGSECMTPVGGGGPASVPVTPADLLKELEDVKRQSREKQQQQQQQQEHQKQQQQQTDAPLETPPVSSGSDVDSQQSTPDQVGFGDKETKEKEKEQQLESSGTVKGGEEEAKAKPNGVGEEQELEKEKPEAKKRAEGAKEEPLGNGDSAPSQAGTGEQTSESKKAASASVTPAPGAESVPSPPASESAVSTSNDGGEERSPKAKEEELSQAPSTLDTPSESPLENGVKEERPEEEDEEDDKDVTLSVNSGNIEGEENASVVDADAAAAAAAFGVEDAAGMIIPSMSEVEQLLPSLIQGLQETEDLAGADATHAAAGAGAAPAPAAALPPPPMPPAAPFIPEQKRIDKDESRLNLVEHIDRMQSQVEACLDRVECQLVRLESGTSEEPQETARSVSRAKAMAVALVHDINLARKMLSSV